MNWTECGEIEQVPGKMSGQPVVKGTRILAQTVIDNFEGGSPVEEIHENYPSLSVDKIRKLIAFAQSHSEDEERKFWAKADSTKYVDWSSARR